MFQKWKAYFEKRGANMPRIFLMGDDEEPGDADEDTGDEDEDDSEFDDEEE